MEIIKYNELECVNNTARYLSNYGKSEIGYITAELKPFSKQQKPDLVFTPRNSILSYFLTYEIFGRDYNDFQDILSTAIEYRNFAIENESTTYIYATNILIPKEWENYFFDNRIILLSNIKSQDVLCKKMLEISKMSEC